ncbi:MAG: flagellar protein FlaG [Nitrospinae bacterium]|nr:flagellar protein FlaG [Nitrospinota bacterium]
MTVGRIDGFDQPVVPAVKHTENAGGQGKHPKREAAKASEVSDKVDIGHGPEPERKNTAYEYDISDGHNLVVKIVNRDNRTEVVRQYPSEEMVKFQKAYMQWMKTMGLEG